MAEVNNITLHAGDGAFLPLSDLGDLGRIALLEPGTETNSPQSEIAREAGSQDDREFQPVVVAPTYNNAGTLADVLRRVAKQDVSIIAVNDGSTDQTHEILEQLSRQLNLKIQTHSANQGKAAALLTGFAAAKAAGFTHALTIDTDDQHDPELIPGLLDSARGNPDALILGMRDCHEPGYPLKSRFGRAVCNSLIWVESGLRVTDSQCGMRVYPLELVNSLRCRAGHYGWEAEILTRATWGGWRVIERPINCTYLPPDRRVSHFRPLWDSAANLAMHARLLPEGLLRAVARLGIWLSPIKPLRNMRRNMRHQAIAKPDRGPTT